ncbi:MAG: hypothetical protein CMJ83_10345 [Planctomycetes bacterium]|nr:hypothetical protein [Planctomycetota bacterium]
MRLTTWIVVTTMAATTAAQTIDLHLPDADPATGACAAAPLGLTNGLAMIQVPAGQLVGTHRLLEAIAFAACPAQTAAWSPTEFRFFVGHVTPGTNLNFVPLVFAGGFSDLGDFRDAVLIYDSVVDGVFTWVPQPDAWAPFGPSGANGTGFVWNGLDDVAIVISATLVSGLANLRTAPGAPLVRIGNAPTAILQGLYLGPKLRLTFRALPNPPVAETVGVGCTASFYLPVVFTSRLPFLGEPRLTISFSIGGIFGPTPGLLFFANDTAAPTALANLCPVHLDPVSATAFIAQGLSPIPNNGLQRWVFSVPNDPALIGATIACQAVIDTPGSFPPDPLTTNALRLTIR